MIGKTSDLRHVRVFRTEKKTKSLRYITRKWIITDY